MKRQPNKLTLSQRCSQAWQQANKSWHHRIVASGILVVLLYLLIRLGDLLIHSLRGSSGILMVCASGLGVYELWQHRQQLATLQASEEDRWIGYCLILGGIALFPFCTFAIWAMALVGFIILAGLACSIWGSSFFGKYPLATFLILFGLFPRSTLVLKSFWQGLMPPQILETFMAWAGSLGLKAIGFAAVADGTFISLPNGSVRVAYGCNGLLMAATMAVASLVLGLFLKQSRGKVLLMMAVGAVLALIFNIPRVMLVTIASVYWGEFWFKFWHDSWGGQIFVTVLFTIYYYAVMGMVKPKKVKSPQS